MWYSSHVLSCPYHLQGQAGRRTREGPPSPPHPSPEVQTGPRSSEKAAQASQPAGTRHPRATTNLSLYLRE